MAEVGQLLTLLGSLFLLGLATDVLARRTPLPRVSLLLLVGFGIGPSGLGWLSDPGGRWFPTVADLALVMVGFLLGGSLTHRTLRQHGRLILAVSLGKALGAYLFVLVGLWLAGVRLEAALLFAAAAAATDPAATHAVVREARATGPFAETLLGVVTLDDAWALILFSLSLAAAEALTGGAPQGALLLGARDLLGAVLLGVALGVPAAWITGRIEPGEPTQAEALGVVFLCGGLALRLEVSFLLAAMVLGATVANLARHHRRPFHEIEGIEWPFLVLFFALAGASFDPSSLRPMLIPFLLYVGLRVLGTVLGAGWAFAATGPRTTRSLWGPWIGASLLPQAGVALGMALVASQRLPDLAGSVLPAVVASTALFELIGPVASRLALRRVEAAQRSQA
jgi:Kef-type K+ transport system membrane component KefB